MTFTHLLSSRVTMPTLEGLLRRCVYLPMTAIFAYELFLAGKKLSTGKPGTFILHVDNSEIKCKQTLNAILLHVP